MELLTCSERLMSICSRWQKKYRNILLFDHTFGKGTYWICGTAGLSEFHKVSEDTNISISTSTDLCAPTTLRWLGSWILRTSKDKPRAGFSAYKSTNLLPITVKNKNAVALLRRPHREECYHCHKVEAAVASAGWDPAALRTEQLNDQDIGPSAQNGKTSPTAAPRTKGAGSNGNPWLLGTAY
jgi:hypothetical protein